MKPYFVEEEKPEVVPTPAAPAPEPEVAPAPHHGGVFDPAAFPFRACVYRIHFKNGLSGEYHGEVLAASFPFDPREVHRVEEAE